ncbi:deoxyribose-phosphate aldolase [Microbacterium sp.]|uniref:deoxyribose-phosphate aldolase n=1 Tax=Microbacterium sp. TaxID=51671 RepID=UPI0025CBD84F|nr:deoxyribose-phosphate aldolase [Microbacterium sp.]
MPHRSDMLDNLARHIDISCVQAQHSRADLKELADIARRYDFVSAHVLPNWLGTMKRLLERSVTLVGSPAGFPSGGASTAIKLAEAAELLEGGAQEIDVVAPIGRLRSGELDYVADELEAVVALIDSAVPLRVILEVGHLRDDEIRAGVEVAIAAGVPWIKTGTGWSGIPTTVHHIEVIAAAANGRAAIKAAGGIRDIDTIERMIDAGVTRFGMNLPSAVAAVTRPATRTP